MSIEFNTLNAASLLSATPPPSDEHLQQMAILELEDGTSLQMTDGLETSSEAGQRVLVVTTAWQNCMANWWKIHEDEDGDDAEDKAAKKLEPIGTKQYVALGITCTTVLGLSAIYREEPNIAAGLTGSVMGSIKISYSQIRQGTTPKHIMRIIALITLIAALVFHYVPNDPKGVIPFMRTLPFSDAAMAVFAKCDLNKLKPEIKVIELLKRCSGREYSKKKAKIISTIIQCIAAAALMNPSFFGTYIAAAGAVLSKAKMRRLVDMGWQRMDKIEDRRTQKVALAAAYGTLKILAGASIAAFRLPFFSNPTLSLIPLAIGIISIDTIIRTAKQTVKSYEVPEEAHMEEPIATCRTRSATVAKGLGLLGATIGMSIVVGPSMVNTLAVTSITSNPGFVVTACQEAGAFIKVATGKIVPLKVALGVSLGMIAAGTGVYLARNALSIDRYLTPGYGAVLFFMVTLINLSLYLDKMFLRAPKLKREKIDKKEGIPLVEIERKDEQRELDVNMGRMDMEN